MAYRLPENTRTRKHCPRCCAPGETLPVRRFYRMAGGKPCQWCKACGREIKARYQREKLREKRREHRPRPDVALIGGPEFKMPRFQGTRAEVMCHRCVGPWKSAPGEMEALCQNRVDAGLWVACERPDRRDLQRLKVMATGRA